MSLFPPVSIRTNTTICDTYAPFHRNSLSLLMVRSTSRTKSLGTLRYLTALSRPADPCPLVRSLKPMLQFCWPSHERLSLTRILPLSDLATSDLLHRCAIIRDQLSQAGLFPSLSGQAVSLRSRRSHDDLAHCRHTVFPHERPVRFFPPTRTTTPILLSSPEPPLSRQCTRPPTGLGRGIPRPRKTGRSADLQPDETVS